MKKFSVTCVILAIALLALVPCAVLASVPSVALADTIAGTGGNVCLVNPIAIEVIGNYVFVADAVDSTHNVILCFDMSTDAPVYKYTYESAKLITNLSEVDGKLAVIYQDGIAVFDVSAGTVFQTPDTTYTIENAVDITYGVHAYGPTLHEVAYILTNEDLFYKYLDDVAPGYLHTYNETKNIVNTMACLYVDDADDSDLNGYVYCIWSTGSNDIKRYSTQEGQWRLNYDSFNSAGVYSPTLRTKGIFTYQMDEKGQIGLYDDTQIVKLEYQSRIVNGKEYKYQAQEPILDREDAEGIILDVSYSENKLYILNSNKQVEIYSSVGGNFVRDAISIGTDVISFDSALPKNFTGFFLAKSLGYPTNIVYKTIDSATSIDSIMPDYKDQFIILNFDGAEDLPFYYVLVGDKYGWIRKSDGVTVPEQDEKIQPINTSIDPSAPNVHFETQFISGNTVFIYDLPISSSNHTQLQQSFSSPQNATVMQKFTEITADGTIVWYYISYKDASGNERYGFIQKELVGHLYPISSEEEGDVYWNDMKINASLFSAVTLYAEPTLTEKIGFESTVKLYSGTYVKVIRYSDDGKAAKIQVNYQGTTLQGWMPTRNLINRIAMTTNATVGLSLLGVAIAIGITFAVVLTKRRKRKNQAIAEQQQPLQIDDVTEE